MTAVARRLTWLDVFTDRPMAGNGLAVVHDADGLDDEVMQAFARETRLSETTFVQSPPDEGVEYRNRIWTLAGEMRFAGHPSLGTAVAVAAVRGSESARVVQQTPAGRQPIHVERAAAVQRLWHASMLQEPAVFGERVEAAPLLAAVGLPPEAAHPVLPFQSVSTGTPHVMAPLRAPETLAEVRPDAAALRATLAPQSVLYLCAVDPDAGTARARGVLLDHEGAAFEDPATGSAAGPLLAYLHARTGVEQLMVAQGAEMGRPSTLSCQLVADRVRVGGDVVVLAEGTVWL
ncbi:MAG TPA: PhzF family phenazine biosynthesis protein [Solirubrobacteraceae bacterium]|nr:PhzF family phenazine biosynthesis protein [Solirubrobacteraceae bacterium]